METVDAMDTLDKKKIETYMHNGIEFAASKC